MKQQKKTTPMAPLHESFSSTTTDTTAESSLGSMRPGDLKKGVQFDDATTAYMDIPHVSTFTDKQKRSVWWSIGELRAMREIRDELVLDLEREYSEVSGDDECTLGVNTISDELKRLETIDNVRLAVFFEQQRQWEESIERPDKISRVYKKHSDQCQREASQRGAELAKLVVEKLPARWLGSYHSRVKDDVSCRTSRSSVRSSRTASTKKSTVSSKLATKTSKRRSSLPSVKSPESPKPRIASITSTRSTESPTPRRSSISSKRDESSSPRRSSRAQRAPRRSSLPATTSSSSKRTSSSSPRRSSRRASSASPRRSSTSSSRSSVSSRSSTRSTTPDKKRHSKTKTKRSSSSSRSPSPSTRSDRSSTSNKSKKQHMAFVDVSDMVKPPARNLGVLPLLTKNLTGWKQAIFADRGTDSVSSTMTPKKKRRDSGKEIKLKGSAKESIRERSKSPRSPRRSLDKTLSPKSPRRSLDESMSSMSSRRSLNDSQKFGRHAGVVLQ